MKQVTLSVKITCPLVVALNQRKHKEVQEIVLLDCKPSSFSRGTSALIKLNAPGSSPDELTRDIKDQNGIEDAAFYALNQDMLLGIVSTRSCPCSATMLPSCHLVKAIAATSEEQRWTVLAREGRNLQELIGSLEKRGLDYKILDVRTVKTRATLTARQEQIIRVALELGFFDVPRRIGLRELARILQVSPRAISEVLRRGERRAITQTLEGSASLISGDPRAQLTAL